jgi:hypothetical protein
MASLKKDFNYKIVKNFLNENEINLLKHYCKNMHLTNTENFDFGQNKNGDTYYYADPLMESLMFNKIKLMEKESGLKVFPTYSFWRMYTYGAELEPHTDRPSCEISVTVQIDSDGTKWPIYMENTPLTLENGDAAIYYGTNVTHSRKQFTGDYHAQAFLHYVDQEGPHKEWIYDKRPMLGWVNKVS